MADDEPEVQEMNGPEVLEDGVCVYEYPPDTTFSPLECSNTVPPLLVPKIRERVAKIFLQSLVGKIFDITQVALSIIACGLYIYSTYLDEQPLWIFISELALATLFLVDFLLAIYIAERRIKNLFTFQSAIDIVTIVPVYMQAAGIKFGTSVIFLRVFRIFRIMRIMRAFRLTNMSQGSLSHDSILRGVIELVLTFVTLVFVASGAIQVIEEEGGHTWRFHDAMYFIIISMTTVGYGDMVPHTVVGKLLICCLVLLALVIIPIQTSKVVDLLSLTSGYAGKYRQDRGRMGLLVIGHITGTVFRSVNQIVFHSKYGRRKIHVLYLDANAPGTSMKLLLKNRLIMDRMSYIQGSALIDEDLERADVQNVDACLILTNPHPESVIEEDKRAILNTLSLRRKRKSLPIFAIVHRRATKDLVVSAGAHYVLSRQEIKMGILFKSAFLPGFSTLVHNLFNYQAALPETGVDWLDQYSCGMVFGVFPVPVPDSLDGYRFCEIVDLLFTSMGLIVIGHASHVTSRVDLCSSMDVHVNKGDILFVLARTSLDASMILFSDLWEADNQNKGAQQVKSPAAVLPANFLQTMKESSSRRRGSSTSRPPSKKMALADVLDAPDSKFGEDFFRKHHAVRRRLVNEGSELDSVNSTDLFEKITLRSLEESTLHAVDASMEGHVIISGNMAAAGVLVFHFRKKNIAENHPIVILSSDNPDPKTWSELCIFEDVSFVQGSPYDLNDLRRCRADNAKCIYYLSRWDPKSVDDDNASTSDFDGVLVHHTVTSNFHTPLIVDFQNVSNIKFLRSRPIAKGSRQQLQDDSSYLPSFASGCAFGSSFLENIILSAFHNPFIMDVLLKLINHFTEGQCSDSRGSSQVFMSPVPRNMVNQTWNDLFQHLRHDKKCVGIGLYRAAGTMGASEAYVVTCPEKDTVLMEDDRIYYIGTNSLECFPQKSKEQFLVVPDEF
eukprot:TRINITY_DN552_c0_g1_i2.p1 TRINITY_DN552_c0_g1~~TRINITY_DN552_c0_g1_i2.p1  ORF type:complete len:952 (+),score=213.91 TRINITY_DN552_c0_g1_i2:1715-4570(+)